MKPNTKRILYWSPRMLCILFAVFLSMFAADVFGEGYGFLDTVIALFMHLIPVYLVIIALIIAWRWEWIGAILFIGLALFYAFWSWGRFNWSALAVISGPLSLVGLLFLANWIFRDQLRNR